MKTNYVLPLMLVLSACARAPEGQSSTTESATPAKAPAGAQEYAAFEISWPRPSSTDIAARAKALAESMLVERLPEQPFAGQLSDTSANSPMFSALVGASAADMHGQYRHGSDELLLSNHQLQTDALSGPDVGETVARARFIEALQRLGDASVIDETLYDASSAVTSRTLFGTGSSDTDERQEHVISYDFLVRQSLNGIPFVNAGVRISVHRSGAIAGVRVGGAQAAAVFEAGRLRPQAPGYVFKATVDEKYYQDRFAKEFPRAHVTSQGTQYLLPKSVDPEAGKKQVLEPKYVFSFGNQYEDVLARRRYVGYSLSNPALPAEDLSTPATPNEVGDPRPATALTPPSSSTTGNPIGE